MADTAMQEAPNRAGKKSSVAPSQTKGLKSKAAKSTQAPSQIDGTDKSLHETATQNEEYEEQTDSGVDGLTTSNDEEEKDDDEEDEGSEVMPAGSLNAKGEVISEDGKVVGHLSGENVSQLEGSMVDVEGDVLSSEGDIIGHADLIQELEPQPESEAVEGDEKPEGDGAKKSELGDIEKPETSENEKSHIDEVEKPDTSEAEKPDIDEAKSQADGSQKPDLEKTSIEGSEKPDLPDVKSSEKSDIEGSEKPDLPDVEGSEKPDLPDKSSEKPDVEGSEKPDLPDAEGSEKPDLPDKSSEKPDIEGSEKPDLPDVEGSEKPDIEGSEKPDIPDVEGSQKLETPELTGPFGVQDNKDITNASGMVIGTLKDGNPQDLVATSIKEIDSEGNLVAASGSIIGKADLHSNLQEKADAPEVEKPDLVGPFAIAENGEITNATGQPIANVPEDRVESLQGKSIKDIDEGGNLLAKSGSVLGKAELIDPLKETKTPELVGPFHVAESGEVINAQDQVVAKLPSGFSPSLLDASIKEIDEQGQLKGRSGSVLGKAELLPEILEASQTPKLEGPFEVQESGEILNAEKQVVANLPEGFSPSLLDASIKEIDEQGQLKGRSGSVLGKAQLIPGLSKLEDVAEEPESVADLSLLKGMKVNKLGKIVNEKGDPIGVLVEGDAKKLVGKKCDAEGKIWDDSGKVIGQAELLPEDERAAEPSLPFEDFTDNVLDNKGNVIFEGKTVGKLVQGDPKQLEGKKVDADGDVLDKNGNTLGKAERYFEEEKEEVPEEEVDLSALEGKKVNKAGNVVDDGGKLFGRVNSGVLAKLIGKKCDAQGKIWSDSGKVIGSAELIPMDERDEKSTSPFEDFPDATLDSKGNVIFEGQIVGKLVEGDAKKLSGKKVDKDGEVVDRIGNVLGKAERWEEPEEPEAPKVDNSALAGKRVNKKGLVVDPSSGQIYGRLVEGDPAKLVNKMCDKDGNVWNEGGTIIGRAELVPESEREGQKEGPFSGFVSPVVNKDGLVADSKGVIIGRLIEGDAKQLYGKEVDPDGDVIDRNGNTLGKAERWEPPAEPEKPKNPVSGRKINRDGNVLDDDGDVIGKLIEGDVGKCIGKSIDDDGDIVNSKGQTLGHVSLLEDIPPEPEAEPEPEPEPESEPEPAEDPEEVKKREQLEADRKLANQMAGCVQQSIDKIKPILKMISEYIDAAEREPKEDLDEKKLVDNVKPLIEEGGRILQEANGVIRGLDPDGRIASSAKGRAASREATPEEYHLADVLKELTENVTTTIDQAKKKIAGMPHAKKELNPLWGLLAEPLGQILAAVGLLLAGVLGLVGRLLSGLGLGGLLDNLLGGLGLKGILSGLGLGMVTDALTGKKK